MTSVLRTKAPLGAVAIWISSLLIVGAARAATQVPAGSDGWRIAEGAAGDSNPVPLTAAVLARGKRLYTEKCQRCHGADGMGHGPDADPDRPAGDLTDGRRASRNPDGVLFYKIWNGRAKPRMPAMKTDITSADVWTIVHYVKTLRR